MRYFFADLPVKLFIGCAAFALFLAPSVALGQNVFAGIYMGTYSSGCDPDNGQFGVLVSPNGNAVALDYDALDEEGGSDSFTVQPNGSFSYNSFGFGITTAVTGSFSGSNVAGTYLVGGVCPGSFSGTETVIDGTFPANAAGYYTGSLTGTVTVETLGSFPSSGTVEFIVGEDGQIMAFSDATATILGVVERALAGGRLQAALSGSVSGTLLDGTVITGSINTSAFTANGSFAVTFFDDGLQIMHSGIWSASRAIPVPNILPTAVADNYVTPGNQTLSVPAPGVLQNDSDLEGDPLTAQLVSGPSNGSLSLGSNGSFTYEASGGFSGVDSFTYRANDGLGVSAPAVVSITVEAVVALPWLPLLLD